MVLSGWRSWKKRMKVNFQKILMNLKYVIIYIIMAIISDKKVLTGLQYYKVFFLFNNQVSMIISTLYPLVKLNLSREIMPF